MRKLSFTQALVTLGCFAAIGLAHFAGPYQGTLVSVVVAYFLWLREPPPPPPGALKALAGLALGLAFGHFATACVDKLTVKDETALTVLTAEVGLCNAQPDPVSCKLAVKAIFDEQMKIQFDGGYGQ